MVRATNGDGPRLTREAPSSLRLMQKAAANFDVEDLRSFFREMLTERGFCKEIYEVLLHLESGVFFAPVRNC